MDDMDDLEHSDSGYDTEFNNQPAVEERQPFNVEDIEELVSFVTLEILLLLIQRGLVFGTLSSI